jgi:hypothetical protein
MRITSCVPLVGPGVIARHGPLVAVTDGTGPAPDPLLSVLAEVAAAAGDGSDLVLRAARAALDAGPYAAWACAGVMANGGVAVLVHGRAMAVVGVEGGPEVTLTSSDCMLPVSRTFAGATITVGLVVGEPAPPDPRFWLGDGVMPGGGLAVTVSAGVGAPVRLAAPASPAAYASPAAPDQPVAYAPPAVPPPGAPSPSVMAEIQPTMLDFDAAGAIDGLTGVPGDDGGLHPATLDTPAIGPSDLRAEEESAPPVVVEGVLCARDHFNDPGAWSCRQCGIGLDQPPRGLQRRERPPLGVLVLDDGTRVTLDGDYVLGREPALDGDVLAGRARPLRINDPNGTVSRLHLKISLVGWQVEVSDLGSANGSVIESPAGERALTPFEPAMIEPGARIGLGHRNMQYLAYQGVLP